MADNEHPREQEPAAPPPAVREPTDITPDQVRQFQEFQRFQELMRQQPDDGVPPPPGAPPHHLQPWGPPPPPPKQSLAKRLLKAAVGKIVTGLVVLLVLIAAGYLAIDYFFGEDHDQLPAHVTGGGKEKTNLIYDESPYETVRKIYHHIANGERGVPEQVCLRFTDGGDKFAADLGYGKCEDAVESLAAKVTDANAYAESMPSYRSDRAPDSEITISSCQDNVRGGIKGGPPLGVFTVRKMADSKGGNQWIITDHENEPPCQPPSVGPSN